jgi:hypothetical protein
MANKALATRQKMLFRVDANLNKLNKLTKPRNLSVLAARTSGAGSHAKPHASKRQQDKIALKKIKLNED